MTLIDLHTFAVLQPTWIVDDAIWLVARDGATSATQASQWRFIAGVAQGASDPTATWSESIVAEAAGVGASVAVGTGVGVSVAEGVGVSVSVGIVVPQPATNIRTAAATRRRTATAPVCCPVQGFTAAPLATTLITSTFSPMYAASNVCRTG